MKIKLLIILIFALSFNSGKAQNVAMDFTKNDCDGMPHQLFSELDSGYVVIMEFIMTCNSCIVGGHALEAMISDLEIQYPGRIKFYQLAYNNTYTCATMQSFKSTNNFQSSTFTQGANMVAYYGGFGMPTVAIAAGTAHDVLFTSVGFAPADTAMAGNSIRNFLSAGNGVREIQNTIGLVSYPNPAGQSINIQFNVVQTSPVTVEIVGLNGEKVSTILKDEIRAGQCSLAADLSGIANGLYLIKTTISNKSTYSKFRVSH